MKYTLTDIYSAYSALQTAYGLFKLARDNALKQLLGKDLADKAKAVVFTSSDLLNFLKETQAWDEEEKFLNEFIRIKRFITGTKYILYSSKGLYQIGTATIHERFRIEDSEYIVIVTNIKGKKSVKTNKVLPYLNKFETVLIDSKYIIYSDKPYEIKKSNLKN